MKNVTSEVTLATLANANELARHIVQEVMGEDIANTIGDTPVTRSTIYNLVQARVKVNFSRYSEVVHAH